MRKFFFCLVLLFGSASAIAAVIERTIQYPLSTARISGTFGVDQGLSGVATFFAGNPITFSLGDTLIVNILFDRRLEVSEYFDPPGSTNQYFSFGLDCGTLCPQPGGGFNGTWTSSIEALGRQGDIWSGAITMSWAGGGGGFGWGGAGLDITDSQGSFTGIRWTTTLNSVNEGGPLLLAAFTGVQMGADGIRFLPLDVPVNMDILPGKTPNKINPSSNRKISVAVLYTASFDPSQIDVDTVAFGPHGAAESHGRAHIKDIDGDGDMDLLLHFNTPDTGISCGDTEATLIGETSSGEPITGSDSIVTVKCD